MLTRRMAGAVDDNFAFSGVSRYVPVLQVENPGSAPGIGHPSPLRHQPISSDDANYHGCLELGTAWNCLELFGTDWNCLVFVIPTPSGSEVPQTKQINKIQFLQKPIWPSSAAF